MKVQCSRCQAAYSIDDAKIPDEGASAACKKCGARILIRKPAPVATKTAVCPQCGRPVREDATACGVCGVVLAGYRAPAVPENEAYEREERFRMSELPETAQTVSGLADDEIPGQFSGGIGVRVKEARYTSKLLIGALVILVGCFVFFQFGGQKGWFGLFGATVVTMPEYQQVANGMSYSQVAQIIGDPGEVISSSHIEGVPGVKASVDTVSYQWVNPDGSHMNAIFLNDRLISKVQVGLR